jgi:hypothetical protein
MSERQNDTFTAACALYIAAVTINDAALVLRSSDAPTDAIALANSLVAATDVSTARGALYEMLISKGWTPPAHATSGMLQDEHLRREGTGSIEA